MAEGFSYSGDPSASGLDQVRFLIGDTSPIDPQLRDAEINWLISTEGGPLDAAIAAAIGIAAKLSREVDSVDESAEGSKLGRKRAVLAQHYRDLADDLRRRRIKPVAPYAGGLSIAEKESARAQTDDVQPAFTRDLHKNKITPTTSNNE